MKNKEQVNSPSHYAQGNKEVIDVIIDSLGIHGAIDFCKGNVIKYVSRAAYKGAEKEDLAKADWYNAKITELQERLIAHYEYMRTKS